MKENFIIFCLDKRGMGLGKLLIGYHIGKNAEERKRERRRKLKLLFKPVLFTVRALRESSNNSESSIGEQVPQKRK
jgi:hypothetical protein